MHRRCMPCDAVSLRSERSSYAACGSFGFSLPMNLSCVCVCVFGKFEEIRIRLVDSLKSVTIFFYACFDFFRFILSIFNDSVIGIGFLNK